MPLNNKNLQCVRDIMSSPVQTVGKDESIFAAFQLFAQEQFHHIVVTHGDAIAGVISDRDLLKAMSPVFGMLTQTPGTDPCSVDRTIKDLMSKSLYTIKPEATVGEAAKKMLAERVSCLPVLDEEDRPLGIVTLRDLAQWAADVDPMNGNDS